MIDLYKVKLNNEYDFIQDTLPDSNGTWLCSLTAGSYVRGYSYRVTGGNATRYGEVQDELVLTNRFEVIETTLAWLNNPFYVKNRDSNIVNETRDTYFTPQEWGEIVRFYCQAGEFTYNNDVVTGLNGQPFAVGDMVQVKHGLRNNIFAYVTAAADGTVTLENGTIRNTTESAVMFLVTIPESVEFILSKMVWWNIYKKTVSDMKRETIGNYSYEKEERVGGFAYPVDLVAELMPYKKVAFSA